MGELPTQYQHYIHLSRYARFLTEEGRRETWDETVDRYITFFRNIYGKKLDNKLWTDLRNGILDLEVMPSMRCLMTAGKALERDNVAGYNCAYVAVDHQRIFDEILYVLMCGTGVGFSVERQHIQKLPVVADKLYPTDTTIVVSDSKIGWAKAVRELISMLYSGQIPKVDVSRVRPQGSVLKVFGGRASGSAPLLDLFEFATVTFRNAEGRKLQSIEVHDLVCKIADIVVVGGVRRSALISLSNLSDLRMQSAKSGMWWETEPHRALANNSTCYTENPDIGVFMQEWQRLYQSKSGERGIFNRNAVNQHVQHLDRREWESQEFGTNPCSEIILRSRQFCNLSEVVIRPDDTLNDIHRKVKLATVLGTLQSSLTDFRYLHSSWQKNTEEERLLGVSLTGIMDHPEMSGRQWHKELGHRLEQLRDDAVTTNKTTAAKLGIDPSVAVTCVKPSGTVSQLVDSASGIHPRYSPYYIRTVRSDKKDPLTMFLQAEGVPNEPDVTKPDSTVVFSFPVEAPKDSVMRDAMTAIEQLELWKIYQEHYCEHKPSITVYVKEHEWMEVGAWVYKHFDILSGVSFLPHTDHVYKQAPYQEITKEKYKEAVKEFPENLKWEMLQQYEQTDTTIGSQEYACVSGTCEI